MIEIKTLVVGVLQTNCYLVSDPLSNHALIIDPADEGTFIADQILATKLIPEKIILTHGHFDHCLAVLELTLAFNIPTFINQTDLFLYQKANQSSKHWAGQAGDPLPPIKHFLEDNQQITFGNQTITIICTPGHTPGSVCLHYHDQQDNQSILFSGDTLFADTIGRTDLSYSSPKDLKTSLKKIFALPKNTIVYPGHDQLFPLSSHPYGSK